ncbi:hypothetical protein [Puerhibacterium sp. TATVAM-FAB25]|uniref:hypothetical protein n=1 Tax=Puerhibacterium sp. TATVAM-FAB25 TaxID=3093699 RepID=UPI00397AF715
MASKHGPEPEWISTLSQPAEMWSVLAERRTSSLIRIVMLHDAAVPSVIAAWATKC